MWLTLCTLYVKNKAVLFQPLLWGVLSLTVETIHALPDNSCLLWDLPLSRSFLSCSTFQPESLLKLCHHTSSQATTPHTCQVDLPVRIPDLLIPCPLFL